MDTVYNAANAASRALFGDSSNTADTNTRNRNPNAVTTDNERPSHETNPFRQTTENDNNPFRQSDTTSTTKPYDSSSAGFGSQHTATSGDTSNKLEVNKPTTGTYDSGVGSLEKSPTGSYGQPSSGGFGNPSSADTYGQQSGDYENKPSSDFDKPITTTSTFDKSSIGDLNKDGARHETSDLNNLSTSVHDNSNPTISSIKNNNNDHDSSDKHFTSRFSEDTHTSPTGQVGGISLNKPSTTSYGEHEHMKDPSHFDKPDTHSFDTHSSPSQGAGAYGSSLNAYHEHHAPTSTDFSKSSTTDDLGDRERDNKHEHTPHHKSGAAAQGSNIQSLVDPNPATSTSGISSSNKPTSSDTPASTAGAATHGASNSGFETANAAPKSVTGASGAGPGAAVEPSVGAHPGHAQQQTPKQQGADRPLEDPSSDGHSNNTGVKHGGPKPLSEKNREGDSGNRSQGTGELYEKSTGVAAEGGDFDASRPGAGREADRLLDQKGIHHGADLKPDTTNITAGTGHSKLLGGLKDKGAHSPDRSSEEHSAAEKTTNPHGKATESPSDASPTDSGHKGLTERIKEKLHLGHH